MRPEQTLASYFAFNMIPCMYVLPILGIALVLLLCHLFVFLLVVFVLQIVLVDLLSVLSSCLNFLVPRTRREKTKFSIRIRQKTSPIQFFRTEPKRSRCLSWWFQKRGRWCVGSFPVPDTCCVGSLCDTLQSLGLDWFSNFQTYILLWGRKPFARV